VTRARRWLAVGWATAVAVGTVLSSGRVSATVVVVKDFPALCHEADLIFVGTVIDVASRWSDPSTQSIETLVTFGDLTWLRGAVQATVTLRFGGGEMDGLREEFAGVPQFSIGERRVIFAHEGRFVSPIVGFDQGALRVAAGANGAVVVGAVSAPTARGALRFDEPAPKKSLPVPLEEFLDRVREQLASPGDAAP
jgi:hypothetical protein